MSTLISHSHKWGFIHIPKTGGTTISNILQKEQDCEVVTGHDSLRILDASNYFIFTFVRNPFTRLQSAFLHGVREGFYKNDFSYFLKNVNTNDLWLLPQSYYVNSGKTADKKISFIGKYENFTKDVDMIFDKLGIINVELPHLNKNPKYDKHPNLQQDRYYKMLYDAEWQKDWVRERYKDDFKQFNYELDI